MTEGELIRTKEDLVAWLTTKQLASKEPPKSVYVSAKVRKEVLTGVNQGDFIHKGRVRQIMFRSEGGGVYTAYLAPIKEHNNETI